MEFQRINYFKMRIMISSSKENSIRLNVLSNTSITIGLMQETLLRMLKTKRIVFNELSNISIIITKKTWAERL